MHFPSSNRGEQNVYFLGMALAFRPGLRITAGPASYPREVLRGERPKWLFVHFGQSKWTPAERVSPRQGNKAMPEKLEKNRL